MTSHEEEARCFRDRGLLTPRSRNTGLRREWDTRLPGSVEFGVIQPPGREDRFLEPPFRQIGPLVDALSEVVATSAEKPFAFFGHSMGAVVAFELTRRLRRLDARGPDHL